MDIKDRITSISKYFRGMQVENTENGAVIYVIVEFPPKWVICPDLEEKFAIKAQKGSEHGQYYFFADMETGFDKLFDAIEYNIKKMEEAQERAALLSAKITELRDLFSDESVTIEELRNLSFEYSHSEREKNISDILDKAEKKLKK